MMQVDSAVFLPHKKMLKFITQKLRVQSLNEVQPYEPQGTTHEVGHYCGSDSEEENHEVEHYLKEKRTCNMSVVASSQQSNGTSLHTSKPLRPLEDSSNSTENIQNQTITEKEKHSSEEELIMYDRPPPEKRKYSQVCSWGLVSDTSSYGSSDEEVRELCFSKTSPVQFGSSPPKHVPRLIRRNAESNNLVFANCPPVCDNSSAQPRKRHRHSYTIERHYTQSGRCVDFEKMQQKQATRRYTNHGIGSNRGARVVRIKSITLNNMSRVPPRLLCDPAVFSFKSLSTINHMTPVEDPTVTAF
ncbi:hypothetical protein HOLleu_08509 [Holothuria leucospilota]|uniref:Uncharacterized protein n=1 Tax=Holothuria leucospilota TaxID=206669 RepID=A0A9Q1CIE6_HOLLE|nr:hypothetical protein HOLleu_08509 [Holothuria leucospilota]